MALPQADTGGWTMAKEFFNGDMEFFLDRRVDWARYFRLMRGADANAPDEVETYKMVLRTTGEICEAIDEGARGHWHEHVVLRDGEVVVPPHIAAGYARLRAAGLVSLPLSPAYGGYGLPSLVNSAYLEMIARADSSLMTIVGLQAGVGARHRGVRQRRDQARYLPGFASGEVPGLHGPDRAAGGVGPRRHHHPRNARGRPLRGRR